MTGWQLGATTDPVLLVPGSVDALYADARDLDRQATDLTDAYGCVRHQVTSSWSGEAADEWAGTRVRLSKSLEAAGQAFTVAAGVLRAHARVLAWAQQRAGHAIDLWQVGEQTDATAGARYVLSTPLAPRLGVRRELVNVLGLDLAPGAVYRDQARAVLGQARAMVGESASAVAHVLELCAGLPDGGFHLNQPPLAGIGDWAYGIGELFYKFNTIRAILDGDAMAADGRRIAAGLWDTAGDVADNPDQLVPVVLDTQTMHDNPGRWSGTLFPDAALTFVAGVGTASRALAGLRGVEAVSVLGKARWFDIPAPDEGTSVRRVFGEARDGIGGLEAGSLPFGQSWTPTQPDLVADFRRAAGLPHENPGRFVIEGILRDPSHVYDVRAAVPLDGNPGGLAEYLIRDVQNAVEVRGVSGLNEPWTRGPGAWVPEDAD